MRLIIVRNLRLGVLPSVIVVLIVVPLRLLLDPIQLRLHIVKQLHFITDGPFHHIVFRGVGRLFLKQLKLAESLCQYISSDSILLILHQLVRPLKCLLHQLEMRHVSTVLACGVDGTKSIQSRLMRPSIEIIIVTKASLVWHGCLMNGLLQRAVLRALLRKFLYHAPISPHPNQKYDGQREAAGC